MNWAMFVACVVLLLAGLTCVVGSAMVPDMGPSEDGFADQLTIPDDVVVVEPSEPLFGEPGGESDAFQRALVDAVKSDGGNDPTIEAGVSSLEVLGKKSPQILMRYLVSSPAFRVFEEDGGKYATRRWMIGSAWEYSLHGYYSRFDIDTWSDAGIPNFQSRFTIGLSGKPWARKSNDATELRAGQTAPLILSSGNQMYESRCIIEVGDLAVEVFEQSERMERRLTKASLAYLDQELADLAAKPTWKTIKAGLPPESIRNGEASFNLRKSFQPGIYNSVIWINPGEPGMIYLKAFEVTNGTALSATRLKVRSNEYVGWSEDSHEQFLSNTVFTIHEGDWGKPYAARFEVWFSPGTGKPERKLMEKVFKIEGWQR